MLLDIHTHRNAAVPGECIFNVEPAWFEPVEGCYYSIGIHPWKVLEAGPEDWTTLEKAVCHPSVLAIGEAGLDRLGSGRYSVAKRGVCPTNFIERVSRKTVGYSLCEGV